MATDPAMLQAQSQGGKAGVEAYQAAQTELAAQRKRAVEQAMAEAQARGAPGGAMTAVSSTITDPYDAQIRTLTAAQARASDAASRRVGRMADYNASVESARSLIGDQVNLAVAPINARSDFEIRQLQQQAEGKVSEIEAQMRLDAARAAAAAAAASRGGGGGGRGGGGGGGSTSKGTLNATELSSNLASRAAGNLQNARARAEQAMRQTAEQSRQAASYTGQSQNYALRQKMESGQGSKSLAAQEAARQAAAYTGRSLTDAFGSNPYTAANMGTLGQNDNPQIAGAQAALRQAQAAYERAAANHRSTTDRQQQSQQAAQQRARDIALKVSPLYGEGQSFFTPGQFDQMAMSPDFAVYDAMVGASGIQRIGAVGERMGLSPIDASSLPIQRDADGNAYQPREGDITGMDPTGQESFRRAMQQAAVEMADEGYKINQAEVDTAINSPTGDNYKVGDTAYDVLSRQAGGDSYNEQAKEAISEQEKTAIRDERIAEGLNADEIEAEEDAAATRFFDRTGISVNEIGSGYSPLDLDYLTDSEEFGELMNRVSAASRSGIVEWDEVWQTLAADEFFDRWDTSSPYNATIAEILEAMYS